MSIQVVSKPNTLKTSKRFEAEIYVLTKDEGGRHTSFFSNYRPQFYLRTADVTGKVELPENVKMVMPGDNVTATFELISPVPLETGSLFYFFSIFTICKWQLILSHNMISNIHYTSVLLRYWHGYTAEHLYPICGWTGQRFALREGGRTVGAGVVSKVLQ